MIRIWLFITNVFAGPLFNYQSFSTLETYSHLVETINFFVSRPPSLSLSSYGSKAIAYVLDFFLLLARWHKERKEDRFEDTKKKMYNHHDIHPKSLQIKTNLYNLPTLWMGKEIFTPNKKAFLIDQLCYHLKFFLHSCSSIQYYFFTVLVCFHTNVTKECHTRKSRLNNVNTCARSLLIWN